MRYGVLAVLSLLSFGILLLFVHEGAADKQDLTAVITVGGKAVRNIATTLTTPISVSPQEEEAFGKKVAAKLTVLPPTHEYSVRLRRIGGRLARYAYRKKITYRFFVLPSRVHNAFAIPGGFVLVTSQMMQDIKDNSRLAWVVAHEISHVDKKHALLQLRLWQVKAKLSQTPLLELTEIANALEHLMRLSYSENMELEADKEALRLMRHADFLPRAALHLIDQLFSSQKNVKKNPESRNPFKMGSKLSTGVLRSYLATHPHWDKRREAILKQLQIKRR